VQLSEAIDPKVLNRRRIELRAKPMDTNTLIALLSLIASVLTAAAATYIAYRALIFTAKPRLGITVTPPEEYRFFKPGEQVQLMLNLHNIGYWYAKPAATEIRAHVNVDEGCELLQLRYGSDLEYALDANSVKFGKGLHNGKSCYFEAFGIWLTHAEVSEPMELTLRVSVKPGQHEGWVALFAEEGDCGVHSFNFTVQAETEVVPDGNLSSDQVLRTVLRHASESKAVKALLGLTERLRRMRGGG
jgi:hypothetical protein